MRVPRTPGKSKRSPTACKRGAPGHPKMKKITALGQNREMYEKYIIHNVFSTKSSPKIITFSLSGGSQNQGLTKHCPKRQKVSGQMASNATPDQPRCLNRHHKHSPNEAKSTPKNYFVYLPCNTSIPEAILKARRRNTKLRSGGGFSFGGSLEGITAECSSHNTPTAGLRPGAAYIQLLCILPPCLPSDYYTSKSCPKI